MSKFVTKVYYSPAGATISELKPPNPVYARTYVQFCIYYYENKLWDSSKNFGEYSYKPTPPPKNYVYGDVNGDGKVNSRTNGDGKVNSTDSI